MASIIGCARDIVAQYQIDDLEEEGVREPDTRSQPKRQALVGDTKEFTQVASSADDLLGTIQEAHLELEHADC